MRAFLVAVVCVIVSACVSSAPNGDTDASIEKLIDELTLIDSPAPGLHSTADVDDFIADDAPPQFGGGIIGSEAPVIPPQMRELVRRGPAALPALIRHLDDPRPTKLSIGSSFKEGLEGRSFVFFSQTFQYEYDPRIQTRLSRQALYKFDDGKPFRDSYTLKVGDVCYALIGQIVNRKLSPIRYQPTANLVVNSPFQMPDLQRQVQRDWGATDRDDLRASLLSDLRGEFDDLINPALARLRVYYPEAYSQLAGLDLKKRLSFEHEEQESRNPRLAPNANYSVPQSLVQDFTRCETLEACLELLNKNVYYVDWEKWVPELISKLGGFGDAAKQALLRRATDPDRGWRYLAIMVLWKWNSLSETDLPPLMDAFQIPPGLFASYPITRTGAPSGMEALVRHFEIRGDVDVVKEALRDSGANALPYLFRLLQSEDETVRDETVSLIRSMDATAAASIADNWAAVAGDPRNPPRQRLAAMRGLGGIMDDLPRVRELVAPLVRDRDPAIAQLAQQIARTP